MWLTLFHSLLRSLLCGSIGTNRGCLLRLGQVVVFNSGWDILIGILFFFFSFNFYVIEGEQPATPIKFTAPPIGIIFGTFIHNLDDISLLKGQVRISLALKVICSSDTFFLVSRGLSTLTKKAHTRITELKVF